jgi:hypothetical protein
MGQMQRTRLRKASAYSESLGLAEEIHGTVNFLGRKEAEAECDRRNSGREERLFSACILLEPVAQRMGGHQAPTTST